MGRKDGSWKSVSINRLVNAALEGLVPLFGSKSRITEASIWNFLQCDRPQQEEILRRYHAYFSAQEASSGKPHKTDTRDGRVTEDGVRGVPEEVVHVVPDGPEGLGDSTESPT